jgi:hypothetical protein
VNVLDCAFRRFSSNRHGDYAFINCDRCFLRIYSPHLVVLYEMLLFLIKFLNKLHLQFNCVCAVERAQWDTAHHLVRVVRNYSARYRNSHITPVRHRACANEASKPVLANP